MHDCELDVCNHVAPNVTPPVDEPSCQDPKAVWVCNALELEGDAQVDTVITNTCDNPVPMVACEPLEVTVTNPPPIVDTETYCNTDTGTWWDKTTAWTVAVDGTLGAPTVLSDSDTSVPCTEPQPDTPDIEKIKTCVNNEIQIQCVKFITDADNVTTQENVGTPIATGIPCGEDIIAVDTEYICNTDTDVYDQHVIITTNGVAAAPVITPTATACDEPTPDFEQIRTCDVLTGTIHIVTTQFDADATATVLSDVDTGEVCTPPVKQTVDVLDCDLSPVSAEVDQVVKIEGVIQTKECPADVITVDTEIICNEDNNVYEYHQITTTNGVAAEAVVTPTTIACDEDKPDFEVREECREDTLNSVLYQIDADGTQTEINAIDKLIPCPPKNCTSECVESQEWTYGIDNTGTRFNDVATYRITLSDGSTLQYSQDGTSTSWTPQLNEWAANIQAAADAAGLAWFVEPRFIDNYNPTNLDGTINGPGGTPSGLPGAASLPVAKGMFDGGMSWRYVNIQICPGQPVPVKAERITSDTYTNNPFDLTTAGAILGPIQKFRVCYCCGEAPVWYLEDGVTLAAAGQIPNCYEPCGTLALADSPPDRECEFIFDLGCDNNNSTNTVDFTNQITRRATVCSGEQIAVEYYTEDPQDPSALIDYTLVGEFVDCDTGEPVEEPVPPCQNFEITTLYKTEGLTPGLVQSEYETGQPVATSGQQGDDEFAGTVLDTIDLSGATIITAPQIIAGSLQTNDTINTAGVQDVEYREGYIIVTQPYSIYWDTNSEGALRVELGLCCGPLVEQFTYAKTVGVSPSPVVEIPVGIHKIKLSNLDFGGSNSSWNAYISTDGVTYAVDNTPPGTSFSTSKPNEVCEKLKICQESGTAIGIISDQVVDLADYSDCKLPCTPASGATTVECEDC